VCRSHLGWRESQQQLISFCDREHNGFHLRRSCLVKVIPGRLSFVMQLAEGTSAFPNVSFQQVGVFPRVIVNSVTTETKLYEMRIDNLRKSIRKNQVSFPSQVPTFPKHDRPDLQQKLAQLYFVLGWSGPKIAARYGLSRLRVQQILSTWKRRAVEAGYIQCIPSARSLKLLFQHPTVQIALSLVANHPAAPVIQGPAPCKTSAPRFPKTRIADSDRFTQGL
jgi:hypothetical protein